MLGNRVRAREQAVRLVEPRVAREEVHADEPVLECDPEPALRVGLHADRVVAERQPNVFAVDADQPAVGRHERDAAAKRRDGVEQAASRVPVRDGDGRVRPERFEVLRRGALYGAGPAGRVDGDEALVANDGHPAAPVWKQRVHLAAGEGGPAGDEGEPAPPEPLDPDAVLPHVDAAAHEEGRPEARRRAPRLHAPPVPPEQALRTLEHDSLGRRVRRPDVREAAVARGDVPGEAPVPERADPVGGQHAYVADATGVDTPGPPDCNGSNQGALIGGRLVQPPADAVVLENAPGVGDVDAAVRVLRGGPVLGVPAGFAPRDALREQRPPLARRGLSGGAERGEREQEQGREAGHEERQGPDSGRLGSPSLSQHPARP